MTSEGRKISPNTIPVNLAPDKLYPEVIEKSISIEFGELEENAAFQDTLCATISYRDGSRGPENHPTITKRGFFYRLVRSRIRYEFT
jgi:hypothetical protein